MAADSKKSGGAGPTKAGLAGKEGIRCLAVSFKERVQRPGTVEAQTRSASAAAGDDLLYVPAEQVIYWSRNGECSVMPLTNVLYFKLDL